MQLNEVTFSGATPIDGYGPGFFRVGGTVIQGPVCLTLEAAIDWLGFDDESIIEKLQGRVDVLLVGTGPEMRPIPTAMRQAFDDAGIGVEPMSSPSACRTYNVLLSEGRRIAVALMPV